MRAHLLSVTCFIVIGCSDSTSYSPTPGGYYGGGGGGPGGGTATGTPSSGGTPPMPTASPPAPPSAMDAGSWWDSGSPSGWTDAGWNDASATDAWTPPWDSGVPDAGTVPSPLLAQCVGEINEVRNQNDAFPLAESSALEAFAANAASSDASSGQRHGYFNQRGGGGVSDAEDEFDGSNIDPGGTAAQVLAEGLLDAEQGFGGFGNLVNNGFSEAGCGFAKDASGNWWVTIEFR